MSLPDWIPEPKGLVVQARKAITLNIILCYMYVCVCVGGEGGPQSVGVWNGSQVLTQVNEFKSSIPVLETKSTLGNIMKHTQTNE